MGINLRQCQPPLPDAEVLAISQSAMRYAPGTLPTPPSPPPEAPARGEPGGEVDNPPPPDPPPPGGGRSGSGSGGLPDSPVDPDRTTDRGNVSRLMEMVGPTYRFTEDGWLRWTGQRWSGLNARADLMVAMEEIARRIGVEAADLLAHATTDADRKHANAVWAWARKTHSRKGMEDAVKLAADNPPFCSTLERFDQHPDLLNVENGTVDLLTGTLHPHDPADYLTKLAPVTYDPDATAEGWTTFVAQIMRGRVEMVEFLQRMAGYCLTGRAPDDAIFLFWGNGANGKSLFLEVLRAIWGPYAKVAQFATFLGGGRSAGAATEDVARLRGARMITAIESNEGERLNTATLKSFAGGEPLPTRFLYGRTFEYVPEGKLILATNHKPKVPDESDAMWRRLKLVSFLQKFSHDPADLLLCAAPARDRDDLKAELLRERSGILNWCLQGYRQWKTVGLGMPSLMAEAVSRYRADQMDEVTLFLSQCCTVGEGLEVSGGVLWERFKAWCRDTDRDLQTMGARGKELTATAFGRKLNALEYRAVHTRAGAMRKGLAIRSEVAEEPVNWSPEVDPDVPF